MLGSYRGLLHEGAGRTARPESPPQSSMLDVEFAQLSDCGRVRKQNEDFVGYERPATPAEARTHGWLFALADGVGGQQRGEVAAQKAVETLLAGFREAPGGEPHAALLSRLVQRANVEVHDSGLAAGAGGAGMATTLVACALRFDQAVVAHVGDSRCYLIRRGEPTLLTRDHTFASEQVRLGLVSAREATDGSTRHLLSRSLGGELFVAVETCDRQVFPGDVLVLCSDGLHSALEAPEMAQLVSHNPDLNTAAEKLLALANERDGSDNISVQLVRVRGVERVGMYRGRPYKLR